MEKFKGALEVRKDPERPSFETDPVFVSIPVGGYHEVSFYQLSRCGEDAQIANLAKFSRNKRDPGELNLIETERIPSVGDRFHSG